MNPPHQSTAANLDFQSREVVYARYAYWCQQWGALQEQLKLMGDDINYSYFGGRGDFETMVKLAAEHSPEKQ